MSLQPGTSSDTPPASPTARSSADALVEWQSLLVQAHYQQSPLAIVSGMVISALMSAVLWSSVPHHWVLLWLASVEVLMGLRLLVTWHYLHGLREKPEQGWTVQRWQRVAYVQTVFSGLGWGALGLFYGLTDDTVHRSAILMTLIGVCAGSAALIGSVQGTLPTFGLLALGPLIGVLLNRGDTAHTYMGLALIYYVYLVMIKGPARISRAMAAQHADRRDRDRLVTRLEEAERVGQMGHLIWDQVGRVATLSAEARRQFSVGDTTVRDARTIWSRVVKADRKRVIHLSHMALRHHQPELRFDTTIHGTGGLRELRVVQRFDYDARGQILHTMTTTQDITELKNTQRDLHALAFKDVLTGLLNRAGFTQRLHERTTQAVLMLDLDHFKYVNDTLGHAAGDRLLVLMAQRLNTCLRSQDTVARLGGDEFAVLIHDTIDRDQLDRVAHRLVETLSTPCSLNGHDIFVSASIGIAMRSMSTEPLPDPDMLMQQADTALFAAKASGRSRHQFHSEDLSQRTRDRVTLEADLRRGLAEQQFSVHFQPKVALADGRIVGAEALLRWQHPTRGSVSPDEFIPIAEDSGLIVAIGAWVLNASCAAASAWNRSRTADQPLLRIAINLSPRQFLNHDLIGTVTAALAATGCRPEWIELEITERLLLDERGHTIETLNGLRDLGTTLAIDDFGTGYSALGYLTRFPIGTLKIDKSFMRDITTHTSQAGIVRAIISMGHSLKLGLVAEGVETEEQARFLREHGCELAQGWHYGRPMPQGDFTALLIRHTLTIAA